MKRGLLCCCLLTAFGVWAQALDLSSDRTLYVATDGSDENDGSSEHPFLSVEKAHAVAVDYLAANSGKTSLLSLGTGTFSLTNTISLVSGEKIAGAGADATTIDLSQLTEPTGINDACIVLGYADNSMSDLTVSGKKLPGSQIKMSKGLLENVHSINSSYAKNDKNNSCGLGLYMSGGTARSCVLSNHYHKSTWVNGLGAYITGGTMEDSVVAGNTVYDGRNTGIGLYVDSSSAVVRRCKIFGNSASSAVLASDVGDGVYLNAGTVENCAIYDNMGKNPSGGSGGIYNVDGVVRYCTLANNSGYGYYQTGASASAINCIVSGNGKAGVSLSAGAFSHNLLDGTALPTGYESDNWLTDDPQFVDAAGHDYHIAYCTSPAVTHGASPLADVTDDLDQVTRLASNPTIGAYEHDYSTPFSIVISIPKTNWGYGDTIVLNHVRLAGVADYSKLSVTWYVDEVEVPGVGYAQPTFTGLSYGAHTIRVEGTYDTQNDSDEVVDGLAIFPRTTYVGNGTATAPYDDATKATTSLADALAAVLQESASTTTVRVATGTFSLPAAITVTSAVRIVGEGTNQTKFTGAALTSKKHQITLDHVGAGLCGVSLTGASKCGGIEIKKGRVESCLISKCVLTSVSANGMHGAGVLLTDGDLLNSAVSDCYIMEGNCDGGGIAVEGSSAVVSNCTVTGCYCYYPFSHSYSGFLGGGIYATAGLVCNSRIVVNKEGSYSKGGSAIYVAASNVDAPPVFRNCLISDNKSASQSAIGGTSAWFENCTVVSNGTGVIALSSAKAKLTNTILWGNGTLDIADGATIDHCCYPTAEEGVDGNTACDPRFRRPRRQGPYHLANLSPCHKSGLATVYDDLPGATDLDGRPRLTGGKVDMGCYEDPSGGFVLFCK